MLKIRQCHGGDFDEVITLLRQLWHDKTIDPTSLRPTFDRALVSKSKIYLVASDEMHVIGFGSLTLKDDLWPEGTVAYLDELVVDSSYRSKGIGAQLLERLIATAKQKGCYRIEFTSAFYRKDSQRFYKRHGFSKRAFVFSQIIAGTPETTFATPRSNKLQRTISALLNNVIFSILLILVQCNT